MKSRKCFDFAGLEQYVGKDPGQMKEMIQIFIDTMPPDVQLIKEYAAKEEWNEVYKLVHKIKPSFEVFKMEQLCDEMRNLEMITRENIPDHNIGSYLDAFLKDFEYVVELLEEEKNKL